MGIRDWFRTLRAGEDREVREEIVFHLDRATQENIARGMGPEEARADALRRFGDLEQVRRDCLAARGRGVSPVVAWTAVAALAAVSFLSGYGMRTDPGPSPIFIQTTPRRDPGLSLVVDRRGLTAIAPASPFLLPAPAPAPSPFEAWRWRDGAPEVKLARDGWYALVSAAGIPAATLREEHRRAQGLPEGMYMDPDPYLVILGNRQVRGATVEIVLRSLADGGEVRMACAAGRVKVRRVPPSERPK